MISIEAFCLLSFIPDSVGITKPIYVIEGSCASSLPSCIGYCKFNNSRHSSSRFPKEKTNSICVNFNESDTAIYTCSTALGGWRVLKFYKTVGHGAKCYKRVKNAIFDWDFEADNGKKLVGIMSASKQQYHETQIDSQTATSSKWFFQPHKTLLATFAEIRFPKPIKSILVVNPVHVAHEIIDSKQIPKCMYSSTSYATLSGHLLSGEERVSVIWRKYSGGEVVVEILSISRPAPSVGGKLVWPLIGRMQRNFFLEEMKHLDRIGKS
mmetsp:Transcript_27130/g.54813  ORF Transcript_27130/g.54813 Transcript_27130/m.54813 type:complete len:267 (-) Transcript_27130:1530-2330(-)